MMANDTLSMAIRPSRPAITVTAMTNASVTPIDRRDPEYAIPPIKIQVINALIW